MGEISGRHMVMAAIVVAGAAFSATPAEAKTAWDGWGPGSSITIQRHRWFEGKESHEVAKDTVKSIDSTIAKIIETSSLHGGATPMTYFDSSITNFHVGPQPSKPINKGQETVIIDGKGYLCDVTEVQSTWMPPCGNDERTSVGSINTIWRMHDKPSVIVRKKVISSTVYEKGNTVGPELASDEKLIHYQQPVRIAGQQFSVDVYQTIEPPRKGKLTEWKTNQIPLGYVRRESSYGDPHQNSGVEVVTEIIRLSPSSRLPNMPTLTARPGSR